MVKPSRKVSNSLQLVIHTRGTVTVYMHFNHTIINKYAINVASLCVCHKALWWYDWETGVRWLRVLHQRRRDAAEIGYALLFVKKEWKFLILSMCRFHPPSSSGVPCAGPPSQHETTGVWLWKSQHSYRKDIHSQNCRKSCKLVCCMLPIAHLYIYYLVMMLTSYTHVLGFKESGIECYPKPHRSSHTYSVMVSGLHEEQEGKADVRNITS